MHPDSHPASRRRAARGVLALFAVCLLLPRHVQAQTGDPVSSIDICDRTGAVRSALLARVSATDCAAVAVSELAAMTTLNLSRKSLTMLQADDFAGLSGLTTLNLAANALETLPVGVFASLTSLTRLNLGYNRLKTLPVGAFNGLTSLAELDMDGAGVEWLPAGVFDPLTKLTHLDLCLNTLETLPVGIFDTLVNLINLELYFNDLTTLPAGIFDQLTSLTALYLYRNELEELPPGIFDQLTNLTDLRLQFNDLTALPTGVFTHLTKLTTLTLDRSFYSPYQLSPLINLERLSSSYYTRPAPPGVPTSLTATNRAGGITLRWTAPTTDRPTSYRILRRAGSDPWEVYVADTYQSSRTAVTYTDTDVRIGQTYQYQVRALNAGGASAGSNVAQATRFVVTDICALTTAVQTALLAQVSAGDCAAVLLGELAGLTTLDLSGTALSTLQAGDFADLIGLTSLDVSDNDLTVLPVGVFADLPSLRTLDLSDNDLTTLPAGVFDTLFDLRTLDLSGNDLRTLPADLFADLWSLTTLDSRDNPSLSYSAHLLSPLTHLRQLDGAAYTPTALPVPPTSLTATIRPAGIVLTWSPPATGVPTSYRIRRKAGADPWEVYVADTASLAASYTDTVLTVGETYRYQVQALNAGGASPTSNTATAALTVVMDLCRRTGPVRETIVAAVHTPTCAPFSAAKLAGITTLDLSGQHMARLQAEDFVGLSGLTILDLRETEVESLAAGVFDPLHHLTTLDLHDNNLETLPDRVFDELSHLRTLDLSDNGLSGLPAGVFDTLFDLRTLDLGRNALGALPPGVFDYMTQLVTLRLNDNALTALPAGVFDALSRLTTLDLRGNDLRTLPAGLLSELSRLTTLDLRGNPGLSYSPYRLSLLMSLTQLNGAAYTPPAPPGAPTSLTAAVGAGGIVLSWQAPATGTPTSYRILRQAGSGLQAVYVEDTYGSGGTAVTYTDVRVTEGATYRYQVQALNAGGVSARSNEAVVMATNLPLLITSRGPFPVNEGATAVTTLTATGGGTTPATRSWAIPAGAAGGADGRRFALSATGHLAFRVAPDYEVPGDVNGDGTYVVTVQVNGSATATLHVTVQNVDEIALLRVPATPPEVGVALTATLIDPDGPVAGMTWTWERASTLTGPWTLLPAATSGSYTPVVADIGHVLQVTATYIDTAFGVSRAAPAVVTAVVRAAPTGSGGGGGSGGSSGSGGGGGGDGRTQDAHGNTAGQATVVETEEPAPWRALTPGQISPAGDVDYFTRAAPQAGVLVVETTGGTATHGTVWQAGAELATAEGGGAGQNFRLAVPVQAGPVVVAVAGTGRQTGRYELETLLYVGVLENPGANSFQSGIGVISGWVCGAAFDLLLEIVIETAAGRTVRQEPAAGTARADTEDICGDTANGFGLLFNWNLLGDGAHTVTVYADDVELGRATVTVTTLGAEFLRDVAGECTVAAFPQAGESVRLVWQPGVQNFVIAAGAAPTRMPSAGVAGVGTLENPGPASFQSGIGVISGWVCEAERVELEIGFLGRQVAAYRTERLDTQAVCGDSDNGFGLLFNWNLLGDGAHTVTVYADEVALGQAVVRVTTLGPEFARDLAGECLVADFPLAGETVTLAWQQTSQNFVIVDRE